MKEYKLDDSLYKYPDSLKKVIELELYDLDIWFIMDSKQVAGIYDGMKKRYAKRQLIPFAKRSDCDDIACFEVGKGEKIQVIHDYASEGYEQRQEYADFWEWFNDAINEMIKYNRSEGI